jgi:hypothetical protein
MDPLDPLWRQQADPLADAVIEALGRDARPGKDLWALTKARATTDKRLSDFIAEVHRIASGLDEEPLEAGRRMALARAPHTFLALLASALVEGFASPTGVEALASLGRPSGDVRRRAYSYATVLRDVLQRGGLKAEGAGASALLRLRLDIAALRRQAPALGFDAATYGAPVSQLDLCHTLVLVDRVALRGIKSLGGKITVEEEQSWSQRWRYAGRLLGVHEFLLPTSAEEAQQAYEAITASLKPTPHSRVLTDALLGGFALEPPFMLPRAAIDALAHHLVHPSLRGPLGLTGPSRTLKGALNVALKITSRVEDAAVWVPGGRRASARAGHWFVEANRQRVLRWMEQADYGLGAV